MDSVIALSIDDVVYRQDLYPRSLTDPARVQAYHENLEVMPPIEVNQHHILIDGWHRWTAYRKAKKTTIPAIVTETSSDIHLKELAVERNATHGLQLSGEDKQAYAREVYHMTPEKERKAKRESLRQLLSVSERTIRDWLSRIDKDTKEKQRKQAFDMWLACYTQEEIATALGWVNEEGKPKQQTIADLLKGFTENGKVAESGETDESCDADSFHLTKVQLAAAEHVTDFEVPLYNVWKQQEKTARAEAEGGLVFSFLEPQVPPPLESADEAR